MNILVTGANGQLGNEMRLASRGAADHYIFTDVAELDITDIAAVRRIVADEKVEVIVNCAAWTNVDACETDESLAALAETLNAVAPGNLATVMKEVGGTLFHISTDYVFGQEPYNTPCRPDQKGTPTGVYGASKLRGEQRIKESGCEYVILRTAWLYSEFGKNFCRTMLNLTATKPQLKVVYDQCGTPTYALDFAKAICSIIANRSYCGRSGIYHYSNEGVTSWFDFACMIARIAGHNDCHIMPCRSSEYPSPVKRPAYSVLDKSEFKAAFGIEIPYWIDSLEICIKNIQSL